MGDDTDGAGMDRRDFVRRMTALAAGGAALRSVGGWIKLAKVTHQRSV